MWRACSQAGGRLSCSSPLARLGLMAAVVQTLPGCESQPGTPLTCRVGLEQCHLVGSWWTFGGEGTRGGWKGAWLGDGAVWLS